MTNKNYFILVINPGSTSTKIAIFKNEELLFKHTVNHNDQEISSFNRIWDQYTYRKQEILNFIKEKDFDLNQLSCVVARGGLFQPIISGTYSINKTMLNDARDAVQGEHASNLGCVLAYGIAWDYRVPSFIVDPPCVDEMEKIARISGHAAIKRTSILHALNIKAMAREAAKTLGKSISDVNLIVVHLGGGISVIPLKKGRMIDANHALSAGPFSPERTGTLPLMEFVDYIYSNSLSKDQVKKMLVGQGGMFSYLGTKSILEASKRYEKDDPKAKLVIDAMGYQIGKEIGSMAVTLKGNIDAIVLTGGAANSSILTNIIKDYVSFLGKVILLPGEDELTALEQGALRILRGEEKELTYPCKTENKELF